MIDKYISINTALNVLEGSSNFSIKSNDKFNKCLEHIKDLIFSAFLLYTNNSFSLSTFLSITIIEEVSKIHMGIYIKNSNSYIKKDKLKDHKCKQIIGSNYTISMSVRIKKAIPIEKLEEIFNMAYSGKLKEIREKTLYCYIENDKVVIPKDVISKDFSKNILLFAIESFDDNLAGLTQYSFEVSKQTDIIFDKISNDKI